MRRLPGASVYAVIAAPPAVFVDRVSGCGQREWRNGDSFCWAQQRVELTMRNTTPGPATVTLSIALATKSGGGVLVVRGPGWCAAAHQRARTAQALLGWAVATIAGPHADLHRV